MAAQGAGPQAGQHRLDLRAGAADPLPDVDDARPGKPARQPVPRDQAAEQRDRGGELGGERGGHVFMTNMLGAWWASGSLWGVGLGRCGGLKPILLFWSFPNASICCVPVSTKHRQAQAVQARRRALRKYRRKLLIPDKFCLHHDADQIRPRGLGSDAGLTMPACTAFDGRRRSGALLAVWR